MVCPPASAARRLTRGTVAGAVGTVALNATTYLDMALRGRPASSTPERTVERLAALLHLPLPQDADKREARLSALGALLGIGAGVSAGVAASILQEATGRHSIGATGATAFALAMVAGNGPMTVLGITDPRAWSGVDWAADVVPHLAYAAAAALTLTRVSRSP